ncbi:MAG: AMP-binding protein [Pseudomonadota bacterium]
MIDLRDTTLKLNLGEVIHRCASTYADKPCIVMGNTGEGVTYRQLESQINRIAHGLQQLLTESDQYFAIMLENSIDYVATTYALKKISVIEVSINRAFRGAPLARTVNLTQCRVLLTSSAHFAALQQVSDSLNFLQTVIVMDDLSQARERFKQWQVIAFSDVVHTEDAHIRCNDSDLEPAAIMFTSGTTGVSKGCVLSHRYALRTAQNLIEPFRITAHDVNYTPYPLSHVGPAYYDILPTLLTGGKVVLRDGFSLSAFWPEVKAHGATWFLCLGSVQQLLYSAPPCAEEKQHRVTRCWSTPAPVPKADFDKRFNLHLIPGGGYGSTDAGWVVAPQWDHPGGVVLPQFEIAIVDDDDNPLPANTDGQLVIRPTEPGVMADGYFGMPDKTLESWRNLWFHTGDIARVDEQGLFYFRYRMAERIRVRGEMVSGFEVEEGALSHPHIEDAAAIGVSARLGEEQIHLFVTIKPGRQLSQNDIILHCRGCMAKYMVPAMVTVLDTMPRTPTGKPEKGLLRKMIDKTTDINET